MRQTLKLLPLLTAAVLSLGLTCIVKTFGAWENWAHCELEGPLKLYVAAPATGTPKGHDEQVGRVFVTCEVTDRGVEPGFQLVVGSADYVEVPGEKSYTLEVRRPPLEYRSYRARGADGVYSALEPDTWGLIGIMAGRRGETLQVKVWPDETLPGHGEPRALIQVQMRGFRKALKDLRKRSCSLFPKAS